MHRGSSQAAKLKANLDGSQRTRGGVRLRRTAVVRQSDLFRNVPCNLLFLSVFCNFPTRPILARSCNLSGRSHRIARSLSFPSIPPRSLCPANFEATAGLGPRDSPIGGRFGQYLKSSCSRREERNSRARDQLLQAYGAVVGAGCRSSHLQ